MFQTTSIVCSQPLLPSTFQLQFFIPWTKPCEFGNISQLPNGDLVILPSLQVVRLFISTWDGEGKEPAEDSTSGVGLASTSKINDYRHVMKNVVL